MDGKTYLLNENGYEVYRRGDEIHFLNRRTYILDSWFLWTGLLAFGLFAFFLFTALLLSGQKLPMPKESPAMFVISLVFLINFLISVITGLISKKRAKFPSDQVPDSLVADLNSGCLLRRYGPVLARLPEVTLVGGVEQLSERPIWWIRAMFLDIHWLDGKFRIYHGNNVDHLNELKQSLKELGIGKKSAK